MSEVFIVSLAWAYEGTQIKGLFDSIEKAKAYRDDDPERAADYDEWDGTSDFWGGLLCAPLRERPRYEALKISLWKVQ